MDGTFRNRFTLLPQVWESPEFGNSYSGDESPLKTMVNNYQLPFYHRLDLSLHGAQQTWLLDFQSFQRILPHEYRGNLRRTHNNANRLVFQKVKLYQ